MKNMSNIERVNVISSNINTIGHDEDNSILEVEFKGGTVYEYSNVSKDVYDELMLAESVGKYFNQNIKNNFKCKRQAKDDL
jgi:hypothetical protein